jgi:hypothetical protein
MRGFALAAAIGLSALAWTGGAHAQQSSCAAVGSTSVMFGSAVREKCALAPVSEGGEDYGWLSVRFTPQATRPTIPKQSLGATWLRALGNNQARRAFAIGEVSVTDATNGAVSVVNVPMVEFTFGNPGAQGVVPLVATEALNDADRYAAPRFLIQPQSLIQVRVKMLFTNRDKSQVVQVVGPYLALARDLGASGGVLNRLTSASFQSNVAAVETQLSALRQGSFESTSTFDLRFGDQSANKIVYRFALGVPAGVGGRPKAGAVQNVDLGVLEFSLDRRPSAFTGIDALHADTRLPDYRFATRPGTPSLRRILGLQVARAGAQPKTLEEFVRGKVSGYARLSDIALAPAEFETIATQVLEALAASELALSVNDQFAAYYAVLMSGPQLSRADIQATATIQRDLAEFRRYKFFVPATQ